MKAKIVIAIILSGMVCFTGCTASKKEEQQNKVEQKENEEEYEMQVYRIPTEKEIEILEECNLSRDQIEEIKEQGMDISTQSFVDTAQIMLDYLEEKYEEEFAVEGEEIPGIISGDYMIFAHATTGDYAGETFEVYYKVDEEGNAYCEDGYFPIVKNDEFQEMMQERADEIGEGWKVFAVMNGTYGAQYTKDTVLTDVKPSVLCGEVRCVMTPEKTEEEYEKLKEKLKQKNSDISGTGKRVGILYCQMLQEKMYDELQTFEDFIKILEQHTDEEPLYSGKEYI